MPDVIFARPRHDYASYRDLWQLVELSGYPLIYIDEIDPERADVTYIYSTPEASLSWSGAKARLIYWLIEWYGDYEQQPGVAETWNINRDFARMIGARFVPIGSHSGLRDVVYATERKYDVIHLSYAIPRRSTIYGELQSLGKTIAPNAWDTQRNINLSSSRAMLHVHQHEDYPAVASLRTAIAAAWKLPLITENGWDIAPLTTEHAYVARYEYLVSRAMRWLRDDNLLREKGEELHHYLCIDMPFGRWIEGAL